jgi:uncharacterized protein (TIGR00296 family)
MPLSAPELQEVEFEISVLSPLQRVDDIREIQVGKHGLLISKGTARGLLLPQVATMYNWDRERFLQETCRKAGLKVDDLKNATVQIFSVVVFDEKKFHHITT